jgi:molecular chaperone DnaK (HSP70)
MPYLIGIDLGTTNSALAYIDLDKKHWPGGTPVIRTFGVPQLLAPGQITQRPLLPSFLYLPGPHDLAPGSTALPWAPDRDYIVGEFARQHGWRVPGRLVTSAKSWLSHAAVDRTAPLLPWTAPPEVHRLSPVEVSARYLQHFVEAWKDTIAKDRPDERLEKQAVVLTVPASFDDMARTLTVEAARRAGLENLTLLEEPQAAFYCCCNPLPIDGHTRSIGLSDEMAKLTPGSLCLVVDVGGGTTDFSLIQAVEQKGELGFVRLAVGDHLLLGGDNMDLALARLVQTRLPPTARLDAAQVGMLTQACRLAKETLLGPDPPESVPVTVIGRGRSVIGGTLHSTLTPDDVRSVFFDGFFPIVDRDAAPARGGRGLHEMGLPYVQDPAITKHLAEFLRSTRGADGAFPNVDAILFNGGVFQAAPLRDRVVEAVRHWYVREKPDYHPLVLANPSLDLAVAWGAAYFNWLKHSGGRRIGGGIARSYYIAVGQASTEPDNRRGEPGPRRWVARGVTLKKSTALSRSAPGDEPGSARQ